MANRQSQPGMEMQRTSPVDDEVEIHDAEGSSDMSSEQDYSDDEWDDEGDWDDDIDELDFDMDRRGWKQRIPFRRKKKDRQTIGEVEWMPDKDAPACLLCEKKFSIRVRRHHCRRCGAVFCANCSKARLKWNDPHDHVDTEAAGLRACNGCVAEVSIEPMFFWLSHGRSVPKTVSELKNAIEKVKELSRHERMQQWLTSPWTLMCGHFRPSRRCICV